MRTVVLLSLIGLIVFPCICAEEDEATVPPSNTEATDTPLTGESTAVNEAQVSTQSDVSGVQTSSQPDVDGTQAATQQGGNEDHVNTQPDGQVAPTGQPETRDSTGQGTDAPSAPTTVIAPEAAGTQSVAVTQSEAALSVTEGDTVGETGKTDTAEVVASGTSGPPQETSAGPQETSGRPGETSAQPTEATPKSDTANTTAAATTGSEPKSTGAKRNGEASVGTPYDYDSVNKTTEQQWRTRLTGIVFRRKRTTTTPVTQSHRRRRAADDGVEPEIEFYKDENGKLAIRVSIPGITDEEAAEYLRDNIEEIAETLGVKPNELTISPGSGTRASPSVANTTTGASEQEAPTAGSDTDRVKSNREGVWEAHKGLLLTVIILIAAALLIALVCFGIMKCRRPPSQDKQLLAMEQGKRDPVAASNPIPDDVIIRDEAPNLMQERENPAVTPNGGGQHISKEDEDNGWVVPLDQLSQNEKAKPEVENTKL